MRVRYEPRNWIAEATMADEDSGTEYTVLNHDTLIAVDEPHTVLRLVRRGDQVKWVHFGRAAARI